MVLEVEMEMEEWVGGGLVYWGSTQVGGAGLRDVMEEGGREGGKEPDPMS